MPSEPAVHPVLVVGGGGFLGRSLQADLRRRGVAFDAPRSGELDVTTDAVLGYVRRQRPATVFSLAAAQPGADAATLTTVNVDGARRLAAAANEIGARLVHVSSDVVLDGRDPPYQDDAAARPLTPYGMSKADGEAAVLASHPGALLVRTSLLWDPVEIDRSTRSFADRLAAGERCALFADEIRCPLDRVSLAAALVDLAALTVSGTLNVVGRQALSRLEFGTRLLAHFCVPGRERVQSVRAAELEAAGAAPRPRDLTLDARRAESLLGRPLPGVDEALSDRGAQRAD